LANKLGADPSNQVLVIEAGPMDRNLMIHIPAGVYNAWRNPKWNWNYTAEAQENLGGKSIFMPRGRIVGGSSSINSMVYMRGHPKDFDGWADDFDLPAWRYENCLPYFKAGEAYAKGGNFWRGDSGPLGVSPGTYDNPLYDAFIESGEQAGQGRTDDPNGANPEGLARLDATRRDGRRCSAAVAHLRPALKRGNVQLMTDTTVLRVLLSGKTAVGVGVSRKGKAVKIEGGQVILSGGAINSPQVLMLSGIGPADHLDRHGISAVHHLPGVGQNLMDHANVILQFRSQKQFPIHRVDRPWNKLAAGARWVFTRDGAAASNIWEAGGLIRGNDHVPYANLQYHFGPVGFEYVGEKIQLSQAFAIHVDQLRPRSRGQITLNSTDPFAKPRLDFNYLAHPKDLQEIVEGVKKTRDLVAQSAFAELAGAEMEPGSDVQTDQDIARWISHNLETDFHPCGTCAMGHGDQAVVDDEFRVRGIDGLHVVDASTFPRITSANLNAPTQMLATRAADYIMGQPQMRPMLVATYPTKILN
ncbi:MAG: GMC family oxidoreductase, partial [Planktomarina sp.]